VDKPCSGDKLLITGFDKNTDWGMWSKLRSVVRIGLFRIVIIGWLSLTGSRVVAEEAPVSGVRLSFVRTDSAAECIALPTLEREISRRMGHDPFEGNARQWIEGTVARQSDYFEVQLFERDREGNTLGSRRLREQAGDCHQLDDAIVLAIALLIDPTARLAPPSAGVGEAGFVPSALSAAPSASAVAMPAPPVRNAPPQGNGAMGFGPEPMGLSRADVTPKKGANRVGAPFVAADALVVYGIVPGVALGAELLTRVQLDSNERYALKLSAVFVPEKVQNDGNNELGYSLTSMQAGACFASRATSLLGFGCVEASLGAVHTVVHSPEPFKPDDRLWAALRLEAGVGVQVSGPVWIDLRVFDWIAPRLWDFNVVSNPGATAQKETVFRQKPLMPGAALGLGLHFD